MALNWYLNGINLKDYGIVVSGSNGIIDGLQMKAPFKVDIPDYHGEIVDLEKPRYEARDITLNCWIKASNMLDFTTKVNVFSQILRRSGTHRLMIEIDKNKPLVYDVYFSDKTVIDKKWSSSTMVGTFSLKMREPEPVKKVLKHVVNTEATKNLSITISSSNLLNISWGDSQRSVDITGKSIKLSHTYSKYGVYYIIISGLIEDIESLTTTAETIWNIL